jgi:hypothetical protein
LGIGISGVPERRMRVMLSFTGAKRSCSLRFVQLRHRQRTQYPRHRWPGPKRGRRRLFAISSGSTIGLCSLSNGAGIGDLPARLGTAKARFGTSPHSFDVVVFSALGCTSITDIRADAAKLMRKPRIPREQNCAIATYWRALVAKTDGFCHPGRIMCKAFIDTR